MKIKLSIIAILVAVAVVLSIVGIVLYENNDNNNDPQTDVKIGYLTGDINELARLIMVSDAINSSGTSILGQYGVNYSVANPAGYSSGGAVITAMLAGDVDVAWIGCAPTILESVTSNANLEIVAAENEEGSFVIVGENSGITNLSQLGGKLVGEPGASSIQFLLLEYIAQEYNYTLSSTVPSNPSSDVIYYTTVAASAQGAALRSGQIQAAIGWEPYGSAAVDAGDGKIIEWSNDIWGENPSCVMVVTKSYADSNPDTVQKLVDAFVASTEWVNDAIEYPGSNNYSIMVNIASQFSGVPEQAVEESLGEIHYTNVIDSSFNDSLVNFTNDYVRGNVITLSQINALGYTSVEDFISHLVNSNCT